jgi:hypothetical protein
MEMEVLRVIMYNAAVLIVMYDNINNVSEYDWIKNEETLDNNLISKHRTFLLYVLKIFIIEKDVTGHESDILHIAAELQRTMRNSFEEERPVTAVIPAAAVRPVTAAVRPQPQPFGVRGETTATEK